MVLDSLCIGLKEKKLERKVFNQTQNIYEQHMMWLSKYQNCSSPAVLISSPAHKDKLSGLQGETLAS